MAFLLITFPSLLLLSVSIQQNALGSTAYIILFTNNKQGMCFWYLEGVIWYQRCLRVSDTLWWKGSRVYFPYPFLCFPSLFLSFFCVNIFHISNVCSVSKDISRDGMASFFRFNIILSISIKQPVSLFVDTPIYLPITLQVRFGGYLLKHNLV